LCRQEGQAAPHELGEKEDFKVQQGNMQDLYVLHAAAAAGPALVFSAGSAQQQQL
jgi:hypothetical protein